MEKVIIGKKLGMTQMFTETGELIPVTAILAGPCPVVQVKTLEGDGYQAVQVAYEPVPERKLNRPERGHFAKANIKPHRILKEFPEVGLRRLLYQHRVLPGFLVGRNLIFVTLFLQR